ncbi:MAG: IS110 family transposase [Bacteroidota bacterium]
METRERRSAEFTNKNIFIGIDNHKKSWKVNILCESIDHKTFTMEPEPEILNKYLRKNFPQGNYFSAYEAGYCGFWAHEQLEDLGIKSIVVNPADVPTMDKERRTKNDKVDCRKTARCLRSGELMSIYIPSRVDQEDRTLLRLHVQLTKEQTRIKNQIKSILGFYGITISEEKAVSNWSRAFIKWLETIEFKTESGRLALRIQIERLLSIRKTIASLVMQIRHLSKTERYRQSSELLTSISGIGILTAMHILVEIIDINRFKNLDELASYIGLSPREHSSGEKIITGKMTKRGKSYLRYLLIEASWIAIRKDPALMMAYTDYKKKMIAQKAIIKIARKLLNRIRFVLKNKQPYVIGVVN